MPSSADMEQVRELLGLIKGVKTNDGLVVASFIVRRVQPCKERAHPIFEFKGETDGTRERPEMLSRDVVQERAAELFALFASFSMSGYTRPFNYNNLPPQVAPVAGRLLPSANHPSALPRSTPIFPASGSSHK